MNSIKLVLVFTLLQATIGQGQILLDSIVFTNTVYGVDQAPDGSKIFTAGKDSTGAIWDKNGKLMLTLNGHLSSVSSINYNHSTQTILTGSYDNSAILWGMDGNIISRFAGHDNGVINIVQSETLVGTASRDKMAKVWERNGKLKFTLEGHTAQVNIILFVPERKWIITAGKDSNIKIWNEEGLLLQSIVHHDAGVNSIAISLLKGLIIAGYEDGKILIIDFEGRLIKTVKGHTKMISGVELLNNDNYFITGSGDKTIRIWKIDGELLKEFTSHDSYVSGIAFSNNILISSSGDKTVKRWMINLDQIPKENQPSYTCENEAYDYLSKLIGSWEVSTKDRTSPGQYEENIGIANITSSIPGCGIKESYRGTFREKDYAREVTVIGKDSIAVEMIALDSEHASFSKLNGKIENGKMTVYWFRDEAVKRLQSKYILDIQNDNQFEFSSFLSTDYGATWALTHERKYTRVRQVQEPNSKTKSSSINQVINNYCQGFVDGNFDLIRNSIGHQLTMINGNYSDKPIDWQAHQFLDEAEIDDWIKTMLSSAGPFENTIEITNMNTRNNAAIVVTEEHGKNKFRNWAKEEVVYQLGKTGEEWKIVGFYIKNTKNPD